MITKLEDKQLLIQPHTQFICTLLSADAPDPENPGFALEDGTFAWSIVMSDGRAPIELQGEFVVHNLTPEEMLSKLQSEKWEVFA